MSHDVITFDRLSTEQTKIYVSPLQLNEHDILPMFNRLNLLI